MIRKEIDAAKADLRDAQDSLQENKFKWATIQSYFSMFHSVRALLFNKGYREKSHYALFLAIKSLYAKQLESSLIRRFEEGMELREEADYGLKFSETGASETIDGAEKRPSKAKEILQIKMNESC